MKRGFVTETHIVIYCDGCGDTYTEHESEAICFDSTNQAVDYLNTRSAAVGWVYDGDRVICDGCRAAARCQQAGYHQFWRGLGHCEVCGAVEPPLPDCCGTTMSRNTPAAVLPDLPLLRCWACGHWEPDERAIPDTDHLTDADLFREG